MSAETANVVAVSGLIPWALPPLPPREAEVEQYCGKRKNPAKGDWAAPSMLVLCSLRLFCTSRDCKSCSSSLT
uniref:Uncharacterized protein n=1 Tax=Arundo donax TaxID=35708 RepID=A0A0A8Z9G8_ARUDO